MESTPKIDPYLDLKKAMDELQIDPEDPGFSEEKMIQQFKDMSEDNSLHFQDRDRFAHLAKVMGEHKFWDKQPIMLSRKKLVKEGEIKQFKKADIPTEPLPLPDGFEWHTFDCKNDEEVDELCEFLMDHYVEDDVGNFKLYYTKEKFRWGVQTPNYIKDLHVSVRNSKTKKTMATIVGVPKKLVIFGKNIKVAEINFLAVHRSLRNKRMAQIMIQEMMRRKRLNGFP